MKTYFPAFLLFLFALSAARGSDDRPLRKMTLKEAIGFALENNPNLRNAHLDQSISKKTIWETTTIGLPQVNLSSTYLNIFKVPQVSFGQTSLNVDIPDGTIITPQILRERLSLGFSEGQPIKLGVKENITTNFTFNQLIFSGEYIVGLQAARTFFQLSTQSLAKTELDVREAVTNAYYLVLVLQENRNILAVSLENLEKLSKESRAIFQQGFLEETDADQIELTRNNIANSLETVRRQTDLALLLLKFQMGMDLEEPLELAEDIVQLALVVDTTLASLPFIPGQNPTFQLVETQEKLAKLNLNREYSKFLPTLAASFNHQWRYDKPDFDFVSPNTLAINLSIPLFTSGSRLATVSKRKLELLKASNSRELAAKGLQLEALQAQADFKSAFASFKTEMKNLDLAERIYNKTAVKFREGVSSGMDLTQAQNQFLTAQGNYFAAISKLLTQRSKIIKLFNLN